MKWVTWEQVGVDRMACAWLIKTYLDPQAEFFFLPVGETTIPEGAEPFDIPGVRLSHHRGHCSFFTMLRAYDLTDPVLQRMAQIVDEADVVQEVMVESIAPGVDLICRGLRLISHDDQTALERGMVLYTALYAALAQETA